MNEQKILNGRKKALTTIIILAVFSIMSTLLTCYLVNDWSFSFFSKRVVRLAIEVGLFFALFNGKTWAKSVLNVLFTLGILLGIISIIGFMGKTYLWVVFLVMIFIYSYAIYVFNTDDDFDAFFMSQKLKY